VSGLLRICKIVLASGLLQIGDKCVQATVDFDFQGERRSPCALFISNKLVGLVWSTSRVGLLCTSSLGSKGFGSGRPGPDVLDQMFTKLACTSFGVFFSKDCTVDSSSQHIYVTFISPFCKLFPAARRGVMLKSRASLFSGWWVFELI
jgi:hypothetical protein